MTKKILLTVVSILVVAAFALPAPSLDVSAGTFKSPPPASVPNDDFKNATVISGLPSSYHVDTSMATLERREPTPSCAQGYSFDKSVWYAYTPMSSGLVVARVETWFSTALAVYTGSPLHRLTQIGSQCGGDWLTFRAEAGTTYYFQIGGRDGEGGSLTLHLEGAPGNDDFANAFEVPGIPFDHYVDTTRASLEMAEPTPSCAQGYYFDKSVWYVYTPMNSGSVAAHVDAGFSPALAVYTGSSLNQLTQMDSRCWGEWLTFRAEVGTTYYLQVGGMWGDSGALTLHLEGPPGNDDFANALEVSGIPFEHYVDTMTAGLEMAEPTPSCAPGDSFDKSVWYVYTPMNSGSVAAHVDASFTSALAVYTGSSLNQLTQIDSRCWGDWLTFRAEAGTNYYFQVGGRYGEGGSMTLYLEGPPENDDFANAVQVPGIPFEHDVDMRAASLEPEEPTPSCVEGSFDRSVWYAYAPAEASSLTAHADAWFSALAVYTGSSLDQLTQIDSRCWGEWLTFQAEAGTTYYLQIGGMEDQGGQFRFYLEVTPSPEADFGFDPYEPSVFDTVWFHNWSHDPAGVGIESVLWDFGDGTTSTEEWPSHQYAADEDYTVELTVTTYDGRSASTTRDVQVRTHDVAITKFTVPNAAKAGQTRTIVVGINSSRYPEQVEVELFRSVPGGYDAYEWVGTLTQEVPVRPTNRTTDFKFSYTFTSDDANIGKVTFKARAHIRDAQDAFPADNEAISLPTKVNP